MVMEATLPLCDSMRTTSPSTGSLHEAPAPTVPSRYVLAPSEATVCTRGCSLPGQTLLAGLYPALERCGSSGRRWERCPVYGGSRGARRAASLRALQRCWRRCPAGPAAGRSTAYPAPAARTSGLRWRENSPGRAGEGRCMNSAGSTPWAYCRRCTPESSAALRPMLTSEAGRGCGPSRA